MAASRSTGAIWLIVQGLKSRQCIDRKVDNVYYVNSIEPLTASVYTGNLLKFFLFEPDILIDYSIVISQRMSTTLMLQPFIDHARREIRKMLPAQLIVRG